jgi:hypothetical protein
MNEQKVKLELSVQQLNVILSGIVKLPIEVAMDTFNEVQKQAQEQLGQPTRNDGPLANKVLN